MPKIQEKRAVEQVNAWLAARFPDVALATVRLAVELAHTSFYGCRVRQYVPVLVERAARKTLAGTPSLTLPIIPFPLHHQLIDCTELLRVVNSRAVPASTRLDLP